MTEQATTAPGRFERLSALLDYDPGNLALLADTADAAFAEDRFDDAGALLDRCEAIAPLPPHALHLAGLVAMRLLDWPRAAERFEAVLAAGGNAPPVRFNLAWSLAMDKRFAEALPLLDEETSAELPQAAELEVGLLHQLGELERAEERARALILVHPDHRGLNAAVSTLAIDIEDVELAAATAINAGDHPDALITLATLALGEDEVEGAAELFDAALARNPSSPRALVGRGLARLLSGDQAEAAREIDRGAELFGDHLGSWLAAGWAYVVAGDRETGRARFERAVEIDDTFGEAQGSLAVIELLEGRIEEARRRTEVALRLDRHGFAAALASMLLAAGEGDKDRAQRIFEIALKTPIGDNGRTVGQSIARMGTRG
ncbi:MAG: tetratricopeptide repeat protein [Pseudomonadota bacterium]